MKKTKWIPALMAGFLAMCMILASCKNAAGDGAGGPGTLQQRCVGTWEFKYNDGCTYTITFNADGSCSVNWNTCKDAGVYYSDINNEHFKFWKLSDPKPWGHYIEFSDDRKTWPGWTYFF